MARSVSKLLGWLVLVEACSVLFIFGFGLLLTVAKIPVEDHPLLGGLLGSHGILFGLVLPILIYSLVPLALAWVVAAVIRRRSKA